MLIAQLPSGRIELGPESFSAGVAVGHWSSCFDRRTIRRCIGGKNNDQALHHRHSTERHELG